MSGKRMNRRMPGLLLLGLAVTLAVSPSFPGHSPPPPSPPPSSSPSPPPSSPSPSPPPSPAGAADKDLALETKVEEFVRPYMEIGSFSGSILMAKGGKVLLSKGYGMANYELGVPNTPQTRFHIASVSKPFTAAAILLLEERGRLALTDPLVRFIPDYPNGANITIHHLLAHRSGIPNVNNFPEYDERSKFPHTILQVIEMFKHKPADFAPGERYSYSNSNYALLAHVIEKVSGESYGAFLERNLFAPLGMADTGHDGDASALLKNRAAGYQPAGLDSVVNAPYLDWTIKTGNGSLYSTVEDLFKWDRALYTEKILKKATLEKMFREPYAWFTGTRLNRRVIRYCGRSPGFTSCISRYIDDDACVIVLANNYAGMVQGFEEPLAAILFGEKYGAPSVKAVRLAPNAIEPLAGSYQFGPDFFVPNLILEIAQRGGRLCTVSRDTAVPLIPLSETEFLDRMYGARLIFQKDDQGQVNGLLYRSGTDFSAKKLPPARP